MTEGPLAAYRALAAAGRIRRDSDQELAAEKLQSLANALARYRPQNGQNGWRERLGLARRREAAPQGLYIYGAVGRGKTMLMDLFFRTVPVADKRRVHFHEFMLDVHARLHAWRQSVASDFDRRRGRHVNDPIPIVARDLARQAWLLCFDEFHVVDIADAMILGRLFTALLEEGVIVVATSNWAPDDLYQDGLQRHLFLPFIALLKDRLDVIALEGGVDYRLARLRDATVYHWPLGPASRRALERIFADLTEGAPAGPETLTVQGRRLVVPRAARGAAWFTFEELCGRPLGPADYLALADRYRTLVVEGIPRLTESQRNETKRFITLIDALYQNQVTLVVSAAAPPERLLAGGVHAFEFERTVSRLMEMQSPDYLARHRP